MFRLAKELGYFDPDAMVAGNLDLLVEWMAYDVIEPFGEQRWDIRFANVCLTIASVFSKKRQFKLEDFIVKFRRPGADSHRTLEDYQSMLKTLYGNHSKPRSIPGSENK